MACKINGIPDEWLRQLPRTALVHSTHLVNHCIRQSNYPQPWKEDNIITLLNSARIPVF